MEMYISEIFKPRINIICKDIFLYVQSLKNTGLVMSRDIIKKTEHFVKNYLRDVESGHDWWHISRVRGLAMYIHSREKVGDPFIIEMSALLHDIDDYKIKPGNKMGLLDGFLAESGIDDDQQDTIKYIIDHISFRDSFGPSYKHIPELDAVQDADRLDAMGAIGIARAFNYGGSLGFDIYNPGEKPVDYKSTGEYTSSLSSTINHFYEKLLRLKDMMNTGTGRVMAEERHSYLEGFLVQFMKEWKSGIPGI